MSKDIQMKSTNQKTLIMFVTLFLISITTSFIIYQIVFSENTQKRLSQLQIVEEAKAHFQGMVDTRSWNAQFGGVYVKSTNGLKPNPYLKNNKLLTDKNETLIKINPAWMTRQISEISNKNGAYHFKITSLKPLNPSNKADPFENEALKFFEKNKNQQFFYKFDNKEENFNFMGALVTTKACMACHSHQGYKIGDIRGGIRVSIPLKTYTQQVANLHEQTQNSIIIVLIIAFSLMGILYLLISIFFKRQYEIENAKEILEEKVSQRTEELEVIVSHEQHLKNILKITTEVNELLIKSYSTKNILISANAKLSANELYPLVLSGLIYDNTLEIISSTLNAPKILQKSIFSLKKASNKNFVIDAIEKATQLKHSIIEKISPEMFDKEQHRRKSDLNLEWMIVLPLTHGYDNDVYGMMTVFSANRDGFGIEEMKILENMAHDISIALYSHKQKDAILEMEKEKAANYEETILAFVNIIEQRDTYTAGHTIRVAEYCALIAKELGLKNDEIHKLEKAAILHDIGKVATPDAILLKPGKLSHLEYELIKQHSEVGADMLEKITIYKDLATIIRYHHSRYDGKGYPKTETPDKIPFLSHIMIVADAFDAMTTNRIYRPRKSIYEALQELERSSGMQFHPDVVTAAIVALKNVIVDSTSQMPASELEYRRMSYFFQDALTGLYNEDYLQIILNATNQKYTCLNIVDLKKFRVYNKVHGWDAGNLLLKEFATFLKESYEDSMILRYHGDDFILLSQENITLDEDKINELPIIKDSELHILVTHYDIDKSFNFKAFNELENR